MVAGSSDTAAVPPDSTYCGTGDGPANSGIGTYFDVSDRVASFKDRLEVMGGSIPRPCGPFLKHLVRMASE